MLGKFVSIIVLNVILLLCFFTFSCTSLLHENSVLREVLQQRKVANQQDQTGMLKFTTEGKQSTNSIKSIRERKERQHTTDEEEYYTDDSDGQFTPRLKSLSFPSLAARRADYLSSAIHRSSSSSSTARYASPLTKLTSSLASGPMVNLFPNFMVTSASNSSFTKSQHSSKPKAKKDKAQAENQQPSMNKLSKSAVVNSDTDDELSSRSRSTSPSRSRQVAVGSNSSPQLVLNNNNNNNNSFVAITNLSSSSQPRLHDKVLTARLHAQFMHKNTQSPMHKLSTQQELFKQHMKNIQQQEQHNKQKTDNKEEEMEEKKELFADASQQSLPVTFPPIASASRISRPLSVSSVPATPGSLSQLLNSTTTDYLNGTYISLPPTPSTAPSQSTHFPPLSSSASFASSLYDDVTQPSNTRARQQQQQYHSSQSLGEKISSVISELTARPPTSQSSLSARSHRSERLTTTADNQHQQHTSHTARQHRKSKVQLEKEQQHNVAAPMFHQLTINAHNRVVRASGGRNEKQIPRQNKQQSQAYQKKPATVPKLQLLSAKGNNLNTDDYNEHID